MIVQSLFDWGQTTLAWMITNLIPPPPAEVTTAVSWITQSGTWLGANLSKVGILLPWQTVGGIFTLYLTLLSLFVLILVIRLVAWVINR